MAIYSPGEIKALLGAWGYIEIGESPPDDNALTERGGGYGSRPPAATFAAHVDLAVAVERLPVFERRCVYGFAAILGGGPWRSMWEHDAPCLGFPLRLDGTKAPSVYRALGKWLGEPKTTVAYGVERACVRLALGFGWEPTAEDEKSATYGRHIRSVRYWQVRTVANAS